MRVCSAPSEFAGSWATDRSNNFGVFVVPAKSKIKEVEEAKEGEDDGGLRSKASLVPDSKAALVLGHISNLCNHVTQKSSLTALRALRAEHKQLFASTAMLFQVE